MKYFKLESFYGDIVNQCEYGLPTDCFNCLFVVLRRFQHCTGHITTGSWKGRGNQYIEFARVVYCKLPTNGKQLPAFPLEPVRGSNPGLRGGRRECYHSATVAPLTVLRKVHINYSRSPGNWGFPFTMDDLPDCCFLTC